MRRRLLALVVIALPALAGAGALRVDLADGTVTTTATTPVTGSCEVRLARVPDSVHLDPDSISIAVGKRRVRHVLGPRGGELSWIVAVGPWVVIAYADRPPAPSGARDTADTMVAIDLATGAIAWRRHLDSLYGAELVGDLIAVERAGKLDIVDARTGASVSSTPGAGEPLVAICRGGTGDLYIKTQGELLAVDRARGTVRWMQPTTAPGNVVALASTVVDGWVDHRANRFGVITYDASTGRKLDAIDLGATGGWYDVERVVLAPDGPHQVLVDGAFGVE